MSELRDEIERQFRAHGLLDDDKEIDVESDNLSAENDTDNTCDEDVSETIVVCVKAPRGYQKEFADDFKNLSQKWQKFLSGREEKFESKLCDIADKLENYRWVDDIFCKHEKRLNQAGVKKVQEWFKGLADLDQAMSEHPAETLQAMAYVYGVEAVFPQLKNKDVSGNLVTRISQLEHNYHNLLSYMQNHQQQKLNGEIRAFREQTDVNGNPLHQYFDEVAEDVFALLKNGTVSDVAEAYNKAVWMHPRIRQELITQEINSKAAEAQKAQKAAFAPKGKAKVPERELTLRELIEKNMADLMD